MIKVQKVSKGKVNEMIDRGEIKEVLTYGDLTKIHEFMKLEVGYDANKSDDWGIDHKVAGFGIKGGFNYKGKCWLGVHVTYNGRLLLLNNQGGMLLKWKGILDGIQDSLLFRSEVYDTQMAEFISRSSEVEKDNELIEVGVRDIYRTLSGKYFVHYIMFIKDVAPTMKKHNGHKYHSIIEVLDEEDLIEGYGSLEDAEDIFEEAKINMDEPLWMIP